MQISLLPLGQLIKLVFSLMVAVCLNKTWCLPNCHIYLMGKSHVTQMCTHRHTHTDNHTHLHTHHVDQIMCLLQWGTALLSDNVCQVWKIFHFDVAATLLCRGCDGALFLSYIWNWFHFVEKEKKIWICFEECTHLAVRSVNLQSLHLYIRFNSSRHTAWMKYVCFCFFFIYHMLHTPSTVPH